MGTILDSSVLIAAERGQIDLDAILEAVGDEPVALAAITASELLHGVHRLGGVARARSALFVEQLLNLLPVVAFDLEAARVHATLSAELRSRGTTVGAHDLMIAATAVYLGYDVTTRDTRSFPRIQGLDVRRW